MEDDPGFVMDIKDSLIITGRGTVLTGPVVSGVINVGDHVNYRDGYFQVRGIESFVNMINKPQRPGQAIGILLGATVPLELVPPGGQLTLVRRADGE